MSTNIGVQRTIQLIARYEHELMFGHQNALNFHNNLPGAEQELLDQYTTQKLKHLAGPKKSLQGFQTPGGLDQPATPK